MRIQAMPRPKAKISTSHTRNIHTLVRNPRPTDSSPLRGSPTKERHMLWGLKKKWRTVAPLGDTKRMATNAPRITRLERVLAATPRLPAKSRRRLTEKSDGTSDDGSSFGRV